MHEEVIGLHSLESTSDDSIVFTIKDILIWELITAVVNIKTVPALSGDRSGVSTQIAGIEPRALWAT